jgi:predicted RNA-binding Zn-ribbon protein involved in translation (DUF1610 family)
MYIFGFSTNYIPVKTIGLPQHTCPNCGQAGTLEMTFLQMEQDGVITHRLNKISTELSCTACKKKIPQKQWTESLKNIFETEKKDIKVVTSVKLSRYGKRVIGIALGCLLFVAGIFVADKLGLLSNSGKQPYEIESENTSQYKMYPQTGDICRVGIFNVNDRNDYKYTLFKITDINTAENKITIAPNYKSSTKITFDDLAAGDADFNTKDLKTFSLKNFKYSTFANDGDDHTTRINIFSIVRPKP